MGNLILCTGVRTIRPYIFPSSSVRIYSIEELCYYLYSHVYFIEDGMFSDSLIDWIGTELKLTESAQKLKLLKRQKGDLKTFVTVTLCSADYYTESEIKGLLKKLDEIIGMSPIKRNYVKANYLLKNNQFTEAAFEYERILSSKEAINLTPEEYGDILHNLAVAKVNITGLNEACELFYQAFERNRRESSLRQYLYAVKLGNNSELFQRKVEEYQIEPEISEAIINYLEQIYEEAKNSDMMSDINQLRLYKSKGKMNDFYRRSGELIDSWKTTVRQI